MSTRIGRFSLDYCRPGFVTALVTVAMIGTWKGRTFLDDDADLADVADFVPAEAVQVLTTTVATQADAAVAQADSGDAGSHPVAA